MPSERAGSGTLRKAGPMTNNDPAVFDGEFPHNRLPNSDATMFIQWKGTDLCIDFACECGGGGHFDGMFAYFVQCPDCEAVYEMGTQVQARKLGANEEHPTGVARLESHDG